MAPPDANNLIWLGDDDDDDPPFIPTSTTLDLTGEPDSDDDIEVLMEIPFQRRIGEAGTVTSGSEVTAISDKPQHVRNRLPVPPSAYVDMCKWKDTILRIGDTVELSSDQDFLEVRHIIQDLETDNITLRGIRYKCNKRFVPLLPYTKNETCNTKNEVCMLLDVDADDDRPYAIQGMIEVPVGEIMRKRKLRRTHLDFPALTTLRPNKDYGPLVCRWIFARVHKGAQARERDRVSIEGLLRRVTEEESNRSGLTSNASARNISRPSPQAPTANQGRTSFVDLSSEPPKTVTEFEQRCRRSTSTGVYEQYVTSICTERFTPVSPLDGLRPTSELSLRTASNFAIGDVSQNSRIAKATTPTLSANHVEARKRPRFTYTFADVFSGCGGVSRAAEMAGLSVAWALDADSTACYSYRLNFENAYVFQADAAILHALQDDLRVDILHLVSFALFLNQLLNPQLTSRLSPPCPFYSKAHTRPGKNDASNQAILLSVGSIIRKVQPRIVTTEETSGLFTHHKRTFHMLIGMIGEEGYDVRYKVVNFAEYGLCQARQRLVIFASRRGIPLPEFPKPRHGDSGTGLRPFTSVHEALHNNILPTATRDDDSRPRLRPDLAYDARNHMLPACITCSGGGNLHPSGLRTFTSRELARCQGFPDVHVFFGSLTAVTRQVGNAVPARPFVPFLEECRKTLETVDRGTAVLPNIFESRSKGDTSASATPISTLLRPKTISASSSQVTPESSQQPSRPAKSVTDPHGKRKAMEQPDVIELD